MGPEGIAYGDKVINLINTSKKQAFSESGDNYIANGEIGIFTLPKQKDIIRINQIWKGGAYQ